MQYILSFILGFIFGSFPTAYLLVKQTTNIDVRKAGSGNVGARNAFDVTDSKLTGVIVLLIDLLKGTCSVWLSNILIGKEFWIVGVAGIGAVIGHNYTPWLKFKGGRGLSTTAGVMIMLGWIYVVIWLVIYFFINKFNNHVHFSSIVATILSPLLVLLTVEPLRTSILFSKIEIMNLFLLCLILSTLILLGHVEPIKELFRKINEE